MMTINDLASDIALEILCGTDRFDKADIDYVIEAHDIDRNELSEGHRFRLV